MLRDMLLYSPRAFERELMYLGDSCQSTSTLKGERLYSASPRP